MNSKEIVRRAIEFRKPCRMPTEMDLMGINDFHSVGWNQIGTGDREKKETYDEWGCLWMRSDVSNMGQVKGHPLEDWSALNRYNWPDPDNAAFFEGMEKQFAGSEGKYISTGIFMLLFERMHTLRGFENTLADLILERERMEMLADRIVDFDLAIINNISSRFPGQIDGFSFSDDWGTEMSTFISPGLWAEFFKPRYKKIFDACHKAGWHVIMHSCGKINEIIPGLIEIGVNVLNLQQPRALGIEEIGDRFRGKVCFSSLCDIQHTLPYKSEKEIREEAELLLRHWGTKDGGFILSDYGDGEAIGVADEKKAAMLRAFQDLDPWK